MFSGQALDITLDKFSLQSLVRIDFDPSGRVTRTGGNRGWDFKTSITLRAPGWGFFLLFVN
jgi:hypothetical protein